MSIVKSEELHNWLGGLNFDVLAWHLYVGDWIEVAIDWVVTVLNTVADLALTAYLLVQAGFDYALQLYYLATDYAVTLINSLQTSIGALAQTFYAVLSAIQDAFYDLVAVTKAQIQSWVLTLLSPLQGLQAAWEDFFAHTLPSLWSWATHQAWWGQGDTSFPTWWQVAQGTISDQTEVRIAPVRDEVNRQATLWDAVGQLLKDPEAWLLARLEQMVVRFW